MDGEGAMIDPQQVVGAYVSTTVGVYGTESRPSYRGTSLIRNSAPLGPYSRTMSRAPLEAPGEGMFLTSEVPLYGGSVWAHSPVKEQ